MNTMHHRLPSRNTQMQIRLHSKHLLSTLEKCTKHPSAYDLISLLPPIVSQKIHIPLDKNQQKELPHGSIQLLGLGLNFCLEKSKSTNKIKTTIDCFKRDIRCKCTFWYTPESLRDYIKQLYITNKIGNQNLLLHNQKQSTTLQCN